MLTVKSVSDLNVSIANGLHRLDRSKIDAIVGIPRSGMIAASILATHLQKPLADVEGFCSGRVYRRFHTKTAAARILLLDDTVNKGRAMSWAVETIRQKRPDVQITRAAVWHSSATTSDMIDFTFEHCPSPRVFSWNMWKHIRLPNWCFDMDGVLCRDPLKEENDDGPMYLRFLETAEPLFIPQRPIGHIVTCRLERYRKPTESWLRRHGIQYDGLHMMQHPDKQARMAAGGRGEWKAEHCKKLGAEFFIESNPGQAAKIAKIAGVPVWCTRTQSLA